MVKPQSMTTAGLWPAISFLWILLGTMKNHMGWMLCASTANHRTARTFRQFWTGVRCSILSFLHLFYQWYQWCMVLTTLQVFSQHSPTHNCHPVTQCWDLVVQKVHLRTSQIWHGNPFGARTKEWIDVDGEIVQQRQNILVPEAAYERGGRNRSFNGWQVAPIDKRQWSILQTQHYTSKCKPFGSIWWFLKTCRGFLCQLRSRIRQCFETNWTLLFNMSRVSTLEYQISRKWSYDPFCTSACYLAVLDSLESMENYQVP